jgi:hypothetical protein
MRVEHPAPRPSPDEENGMARRTRPRKVTYFEPVPPRLISILRLHKLGA